MQIKNASGSESENGEYWVSYEIDPCPLCGGEGRLEYLDYSRVRATSIDQPISSRTCGACCGDELLLVERGPDDYAPGLMDAAAEHPNLWPKEVDYYGATLLRVEKSLQSDSIIEEVWSVQDMRDCTFDYVLRVQVNVEELALARDEINTRSIGYYNRRRDRRIIQ